MEPLLWDTSIQGKPSFRGHKIWRSQKKCSHNLCTCICDLCWRDTSLQGKGHFCWVPKPASFRGHFYLRDTCLGPEGVPWIEFPLYTHSVQKYTTCSIKFWKEEEDEEEDDVDNDDGDDLCHTEICCQSLLSLSIFQVLVLGAFLKCL